MYPSTLDQTMVMDTSVYLPENATQMALTSNESTSLTSEGSKDDAMRDTSRLTAVVLGVIIALGVIATVMTVIVLSSRSNLHEKTIGTEEENIEGAASGVIVVAPDLKLESTAPALASKRATSTTRDNTGHATEKPFTVPETTSWDIRFLSILFDYEETFTVPETTSEEIQTIAFLSDTEEPRSD